MRIFRFIISGGTATAVSLGTLFVLTHFFGVWYLLSSIFAFAASFLVSFTMQKFWTFSDASIRRAHVQALKYFFVIIIALGINTALIYIFVEYVHIHYLLAQFISGVFIAFINYFSYKHLVFPTDEEARYESAPQTRWSRVSLVHVFFVLLATTIFTLLALYRLSENPPTWLDEGTIIQVAINLVQNGIYGLQIAPAHFISTDFLTTSFPVIYPIALSFSLFGTTILNARVVMVLFMALLCALSYFLIRSLAGEKRDPTALLSLLLLVTFAPLYGHGKNVLGEVPGLMFFVASLLVLHFAHKYSAMWLWTLSGVLVGLSMATKPIYLFIIVPSAFLIFLIQRRHISFANICAYAAGALSVLLLWFSVHFTSIDALREILFAANANNMALVDRLLHTGAQFISELQPMYFLGLLTLWWVSLCVRKWKKVKIPSIELYAGIFTVVSLILYLASRGFYRYFFPAEALALIFLPLALYQIPVKEHYRKLFLKTSTGCIVFLILFQGYQTLFHSWISEYRSSTRSSLLSENMHSIPEDKSVFLYNVPEAVIFLSSQNYYQYLRFGDNVIRGDENLPLLFNGAPDFVLVDLKFQDTEKILPLYIERSRFNKYILYERKNGE